MRSKPFVLPMSCRGAVFVALVAAASACSQPQPDAEAQEFGHVMSALGATYVVTNNLDAMVVGSLRYGITNLVANGYGKITFAPGVGRIVLTSALPAITAPGVIIEGLDASACPKMPAGSASMPVEIDGSALSAARPTDTTLAILKMEGGNGLVRGIAFTNIKNNMHTAAAIVLDSDGNKVQCNFFGTDAAGLEAASNKVGVLIKSGAGTIVGVDADGFNDDREGNLISGQNIGGYGAGVRITGGQNARVAGNLIGVDITGATALGNFTGIDITGGTGTLIGISGLGTSDLLQRNLISGNVKHGVLITDSTGNRISGNHIGVNAAGATAIANGENGIHLAQGASGNIIGFANKAQFTGWALQRNVISGNQGTGVLLEVLAGRPGASTNNRVSGNYIGIDASGTLRISNAEGVRCGWNSTGHIIGTNGDGVDDDAERNVISGNNVSQITVGTNKAGDSSGTQIAGNYIGTDSTGTQALYAGRGILLQGYANNTRIGTHGDGSTGDVNRRNVISGNTLAGVGVLPQTAHPVSGVQIKGNYIGVDRTGSAPLSNGGGGIDLRGFSATHVGPDTILIGGPTAVEANLIAQNKDTGVKVGPNTRRIRIQRNAIFGNQHRDILLDDAVTSNDGIAPPVMTSVTVAGATTTLEGTFEGAINTEHELEFFDNDSCHVSLIGGGQRFLGSINVTTNAAGIGSFTHSVSQGLANPHQVTATLTDTVSLNTSIFSRCANDPVRTTTSISLSSNNVVVGSPVTATVKVTGTTWGPLDGTVTVTDGGAFACTATLDADGEGSCELTASVVGARTITATYSATTLYIASLGEASLTVTKASTTTTITGAAPATSMVGQAVIVSVKVASTVDLTSDVTVSDGTTSCTAQLANGEGDCTLAFPTAGNRTLTATYPEDALHLSSTDSASYTVSNATTTTTVTMSPSPAVEGEELTVTVTVSATTSGTPTGTVTVTVGDQTCTATLSNGQASCTVTPGTTGSTAVDVQYSGDENHQGSSESEAIEVLPAAPSLSIAVFAGSPQATGVTEAFADALVVLVVDMSNTPMPGVLVSFSAPLTGASAVLSTTTATTDAQGHASLNATANQTSGGYSVVATVEGAALPATFELVNQAGVAVSLTADVAGTPQSQQVGARYAKALAVTLRDAFENPVAGVEVSFTAPAAAASATLSAAEDVTDEEGVASVTATANSTEGAFVVTATVGGIAATFDLTNLERAPATIAVVSGSPQKAALTTAFAKPLVVVVKDASGAVVPDVEVSFSVPATGASVTAESLMATTDANGAAEISVTANDIAGEYVVAASAEGAESPATFHLSNTEDTHRLLTTGGGLSCASGSGAGMMALLFAGLLLMLRRRRAGVVLALVVVALPVVSSAQGFDINRYRTAALAGDGLTLERPTALENGGFDASLTFSFARNPLVERVVSENGTPLDTYALIRNQLNGALSLSYGLLDRVTIHGTLPFSLMQSGDAPNTSSFLTSAGSTAMGDLRLGARVRIVDGVGFDAAILLPTGSPESYMSDGNVRGELKLLGEVLPMDFLYAGANLGVMLRSGVAFGPSEIGSSLVVGAAAGYRTEADEMRFGIEANSDIAFTSTEGAARAAIEAYGVASVRFAKDFHATVGVGPGLTNAIGTPAWRGLVRIGWTPGVQSAPEPVVASTPEPVVEPAPVVEPEPEPVVEPEPEPAPVQAEVVAVVKAFQIPQRIQFELGEAGLLAKSDPYLSTVARLLLDNPSVRVSIEGHTDDLGTDAVNQDLSERRAAAVREALMAKGVGGSRLTTKGFGKSRPVTDNTSETGRERNRRVEFIVVK